MSYCLNPYCQHPNNLGSARFCVNCGFRLLLGDRYRAVQQIGQGGFGKTFLAVDEYKPSRPRCVIKQFFPERQGTKDLARSHELFEREAIQLERLGNHPQIPELLAHFEQDRYHFLVQEYIDGANLLQEIAQKGAFSDRQIWQLLVDLLPVLDYIHEHQVIHRDIKPQNIIRRRNGQQYVLVDFGAAKSINANDLVHTGTSIGSPEFVPPEQVIGKATYASDLYSLGVTCLYLLTGVRPADLYDTEEGLWNWQPRLVLPMSTSLSHVLDRMIQGPVKRRYGSAAEVLKDLHHPALLAQLAAERETTVQPQPLVMTPPPDLKPEPPSFATTRMPVSQLNLSDRWVCTQTLSGHQNWVRAVVVHPNNELLMSGSGDKTLRFWRLPEGELIREVAAHTSWVRAIALSSDQQTLASASNDRTIKLWNCHTGDLLNTFTAHQDWVRAVAFNPTGQILFSGSQDKTIRVWEVATGKSLLALNGHEHWVVCLACGKTADGKVRLFSGSRDATIRVWSGNNGALLQTLTGHESTVNALALHPDGKTLISGSDDGTIRLWNLQTGHCLHNLTENAGAVYGLAISSDANWLVSGGQNKALKVWHLPTRTPQADLEGHLGWIWTIAFSQNDEFLVSGSWDATVKIWQRTSRLPKL